VQLGADERGAGAGFALRPAGRGETGGAADPVDVGLASALCGEEEAMGAGALGDAMGAGGLDTTGPGDAAGATDG